ncbi:MAG: AMP-binding protein [Deltaproteobacteria bacterium]|nr:AMP-binding protein [Deltaproteobacteria bacterium]
MTITSATVAEEATTFLPEAATPAEVPRPARGGLVLRLRDARGRHGLGCCAPLPGWSTEDLPTARAALESLTRELPGSTADDPEQLLAAWDAVALPASARHALEQAVLDLASQRLGFPVHALLGAARPTPVVCHRLVRDADDAVAALRAGARTLKIKVGRASLAEDDRRVEAIRAAVGPDVALRLDANGAWPEAAAVRALALLGRHGIALCEEPVAGLDPETLARVRAHSRVPLAADERCRDLDDLEALIAAGACDAVVVKPMLVGGPRRAVAMARRAARAGLGVIVTTSFESALGWRAALWVAQASPPEATLASGLDPATAISGPAAVPWADAVPNPVASAALARPEHPALAAEGASLDYTALARAAAGDALSLAGRGLGPRSVVAVVGRTDPAFARALHAVGWLGATCAPVAAGPELARDLDLLRPDAVLSSQPESCPPGPWEVLALTPSPGEHALPERPWPLSEPRLRLLTSGTTATPRAVTLSTTQLLLSAFGSATRLGLDPADRWLCCLPLCHIGGLSVLLRSAFQGTTAVLAERFDPEAVNGAIDRGELSVLSLVPTMVERLLDARQDRPFPRSLRAILIGGAAASQPLLERLARIGAPASLSWGMSEAASQVATTAPGDLGPGAPPLPFARVGVLASGALTVWGPLVGGALVSGDQGRVDAAGRVVVSGRRDAVIISGGENIAPEELEAALCAHPAITAAAVAGLPHPRWGARPVAAVVLRPGEAAPGAAALRAHLAERLAPFKVPDRVAIVAALPRTALGKVSAAGVRRLFDQAEGRQGLPQGVGDAHAGEAVQAHAGVDQAHVGAQIVCLRAADLIGEGDGAPAQPGHPQRDPQAVAQAHGPAVVGLGVHQRQPVAALVEDGEQRLPAGHEHLLEAGVAVLEDAPEERDAGPVDLVEADGDDVLVGHGRGSFGARGRRGRAGVVDPAAGGGARREGEGRR